MMPGGPELLGHVDPIQADFGQGKVLLLQIPDVLGAIRQEDRPFLAVSALSGFEFEPTEQLCVTGEGSDEALVDGAFESARRLSQRVDGANYRQFRVLALLAFGTTMLGMLARLTHAQLEAYIVERTREIARDVVQEHLDLRAIAEQPVRVVGSDGVERKQRRSAGKRPRLLVGDVTVQRLLYQARGVDGLSPQDGALSLAQDGFSIGVRRRVVEEAIRGSFDEVVERLDSTTGTHVAKRQAEQLGHAHLEHLVCRRRPLPSAKAIVLDVGAHASRSSVYAALALRLRNPEF